MKKSVVVIVVIVFLLVLASIAVFFFYTGLKIEGIVIDSIEKKPVASATIRINDKTYFTDANGSFKTYLPIYPSAVIIVEKNDYRTFTKSLDNQWFIGTKKYELLLEPLSYSSILDSAKNDLLTYLSYSFRYVWYSRIGETNEKHDYMIYQIDKSGSLRFKYLQDDRFGNLITSREIIRTGNTVFYTDADSKNWIRIREEDITASKLQDPYDILQIFNSEEAPGLFVFDEDTDLYDNRSGILLNRNEAVKLSSELIAEYPVLKVKTFSAKWSATATKKNVLLYLDSNYRLLRADLAEESPDETGKTIKQSLSFYITSIDQDIEIEIPRVE